MAPAPSRRVVSALLVGPAENLESLFPDGLRREVDCAADAASAIAHLTEKSYDVVLINHVSDGDVTEQQLAYLRAAQAAARPGAKFVLLVARNTLRKVVEALRYGVFAYFSRPFDAVAVRYAILRAVALGTWADGVELISTEPDFISVRMRCRLDTAERLAQFMRELPCDLSDTEKAELATAFGEMLFNAIEHGGKLDPNEWVRVSRIRTRRAIVYHVHDPGEGFSRADLKHAAISNPPDNPVAHLDARAKMSLRPGGFGMLMATRFADEAIYNERGNEVILIKYLDSPR